MASSVVSAAKVHEEGLHAAKTLTLLSVWFID
jgi:hypothetical protein